eukprot:gene8027-10855_t
MDHDDDDAAPGRPWLKTLALAFGGLLLLAAADQLPLEVPRVALDRGAQIGPQPGVHSVDALSAGGGTFQDRARRAKPVDDGRIDRDVDIAPGNRRQFIDCKP